MGVESLYEKLCQLEAFFTSTKTTCIKVKIELQIQHVYYVPASMISSPIRQVKSSKTFKRVGVTQKKKNGNLVQCRAATF